MSRNVSIVASRVRLGLLSLVAAGAIGGLSATAATVHAAAAGSTELTSAALVNMGPAHAAVTSLAGVASVETTAARAAASGVSAVLAARTGRAASAAIAGAAAPAAAAAVTSTTVRTADAVAAAAPAPAAAPASYRSMLISADGSLRTGIAVYSDCSGRTPLTHTAAAIDTCIGGRTFFVGHNPGVFTPFFHMGTGSRLTWWDASGTAHQLVITLVRVWAHAGMPPAPVAGSTVQFQTCITADGSVDRLLDAAIVG